MRAKICRFLTLAAMTAGLAPPSLFAASHREAPVTALDRAADITDYYSFVSYDKAGSGKVTFIMNVDPLLEPANGPNYFPFDPNILYEINIDNSHNAKQDIIFRFQFATEIRAPGVYTGFVGAGNGISSPANSPAPVKPGTPIIPPAITSLDGPGSAGLSLRQTYTLTMLRRNKSTGVWDQTILNKGKSLFALPSNVGPRTMPNYPALFQQAIYPLDNGIQVFCGTVEDPFYIDLGAAFDTVNLRASAFTSGVPGVLTNAQDADDAHNITSDSVSGYNVNSIAIEVPISLLTSTGTVLPATDPNATIGSWGTTSRPRITVRRDPTTAEKTNDQADLGSLQVSGGYRQVQRMGNPLINELIIGTGSKDYWSMSAPADDSQFASFDLDPLVARALNAAYAGAVKIPPAPRVDLLPLVQYVPPIAAKGTPAGPIADLLRLNTGVPATLPGKQHRLGLLAHDSSGNSTPDVACYPNGRRIIDDVTDISLRVVAGVLAGPPYNGFPNNRLGDGVNVDDIPAYRTTFPYVSPAFSGRDRRHIDPGEPGGGPVN